MFRTWPLVVILVVCTSHAAGQIHRAPANPRFLQFSSRTPAALTSVARPQWSGAPSGGVLRRVPQDHPTIQSAIDAAGAGDTVLVAEGTYFENIRFRGKAIILASLYLTDGDTTHIEKTIVDGSHATHPDSGSVVYFVNGEDSTSVLCGLTILGGRGTRWAEGYSNPRAGGGIYCLGSGPRIVKNIITRNRAIGQSASGGGVAAENLGSNFPYIILEQNRITDNYAGGDSPDTWGYSGGADLWRVRARVVGNLFERDTAVSVRRAAGGGLFFGGGDVSRFVEPPFVTPGPFPEGLVLGNIFRKNVVNSSTQGAVGAGAFIDATAITTIADNVFEENLATSVSGWAQGGALAVKDRTADGHGRKILASNRFLGNQVICANSNSGGGALELFYTTITISGNLFANNHARAPGGPGTVADGGAVLSEYSSFRIAENVFAGNTGQVALGDGGAGGAIAVGSAPPHGGEQVVVNNLLTGNSIDWGGGAIGTWENPLIATGRVIIANNTIVGNGARSTGGGIVVINPGDRIIMNNILWDDWIGAGGQTPNEIGEYSGSARYYHNDVKGGWQIGEGNIGEPPAFEGSVFFLSDSSACIGAGIDSVEIDPINGWLYAPPLDFSGSPRPDPSGSFPDIGARENPLPISTNASALVVHPLSYDFHNVRPGSVSDTIRITVVNRSGSQQELLSLSALKPEFAFCPAPVFPVTIAPQGRTELTLVFIPVEPGVTVRDTLRVTTTDPFYPGKNVILTGRGSDAARAAHPGVLYGISATSGVPTIVEIDQQTGRVSASAQLSPLPPVGVEAMTIRRRDNSLYAAFASAYRTDLYRVSSQNGDCEKYVTLPLGDVTAMAFNAADALFVVTAGSNMYRVEGGTADAVYVGSTDRAFTGLAFSPATGALWASARDSLFTLDPLSATAILVGASARGAPRSSIAFNGLGTMYGLYGTRLVILDKTGGSMSDVGETGDPDLVAIAMRSDPGSVDVSEAPTLPLETELFQNFPNPFNPTTRIKYRVGGASGEGKEVSFVRLTIHDLLGREVAVLANREQSPGTYEVSFQATGLATGVYFCRLTAGTFARTEKMILLR